ncbi:hypothetical protein CBR_g40567 [Chara braunii]|uniref:Reverse transcriptase domain-containing protein n=1 Tax=Chara braunii TaxID=69332 RepID=A0A388K268_CHABU|nr:hypothetical protein CBR_g40567 [Chara braunii]|eukprot:GBG64119.1 hypothetical protein CBR_g40567 [Chara braunii]
MSPKPFSGDRKKEEDLDTWVRTVPTYVRHKLTRPEQEIVVAASFLEGSAARWLNDLVQQQGYGEDFDAWAQAQTLEQFVRSVYNTWHDPQGAQKATDAINNLCSRRFKDVRELTNNVERLLVVPGVRFDQQVLLTDYLRCLLAEVRTKLVDEAYVEQHTFASFSKKALDIEAKLGTAHRASHDGRKRLPQDWKKKGLLMSVDHDGQTTKIDEFPDLGEFTEQDGASETSDGGVVAPIKEKARGIEKKKVGRQPIAAPGSIEYAIKYEQMLEKAVEHIKKSQDAMIASENKHRRPSNFQRYRNWGLLGAAPNKVMKMVSTIARPRLQDTSAVPRQQQRIPHQQAPAWSMLLRSHTTVMDQRPGEADEAYQARMLAWSTETKKRADDVAAAAKKKEEDAEQARLMAIEQQRQHDDAAARAVDEERHQRRKKIFTGEQALLTMAAEWRTEAENSKLEDSANKIALLSHLTDLLATCITQQEEIHSLDNSLAHVQNRLQRLEQPPAAAADASSSNTSDRLNALEMDVGSLKDGVQLQQTATQQLQQRICTTANISSSEPRETAPKFDGQDIFCDSMKTNPVPWFRKFELTLQLHDVKEHKHHAYLYSRSGGACQAWLDSLLSKYGVVANDLHTKISWDDLKAAWHKRFQVEPPETKAMDKLMVFEQGTLPSTDWIAEYQRLASVPDIQMGFKAIRHYFISRSWGACQAWLDNLLSKYGVVANDLHTKISWDDLKVAWHKRFQVEPPETKAMDKLMVLEQGTLPSTDWIAEYQRLTSVPDIQMGFKTIRHYFISRSCPTLSNALTHVEDTLTTTAELFDKAAQIIITNKEAKNLHAGLPIERQGQTGKLSTTESDSTTLSTPSEPVSSRVIGLHSEAHAEVDSPPLLLSFEDYAARLVPTPGTQAQGQEVCAVSSPSGNDDISSSSGSSRDSAREFNIEALDPLTSEDFAWLPLPTTGRMPGPQCAALSAHLHTYLSFYAPPTSPTDDKVAVGDILAYTTKVAREFRTHRYDDNNAPLMYVRIQVGQASCSASLDSGASRNFMSQSFMQRAGVGAQFWRKANPTAIKLADGKTQQLLDRYIEAVPVYFAPHACEPVTFDILDTDFDIILGMPWLASADHAVNFHRRTLSFRDPFGAEVACTIPLPHPSILCQVVTAKSFRATCAYQQPEEIGLCFLQTVAVADSSPTDLSSDPRVVRLLDEFADIFEPPTGVVPDRPISHEMILEAGVVPPKGCIYRMSEEELEVLRAQLDDLLAKGWIRPSSSPYGAPVLFVRKRNKDLRLCIDYRKLNAQTVKNAEPLPRIDDLLERLGGAKYFSKLDLKSRYHQISIRPNDRYKTAFKTRYGHFEWVVMPFGLTNAPTTFQAAMTNEFRAMLDRFVLVYLDDILVYSRTLEDHLGHLRRVLETLRRAKYKANHDKCEFVWQELEYLGHFVTPEGIFPLSDKIQAIQEWAEPRNVTDATRRSRPT